MSIFVSPDPGAVVQIDAQTGIAGAVSIDIRLPQGFVRFSLVWRGMSPAVDTDEFRVRLSNDGGATFVATAGAYGFVSGWAQTNTAQESSGGSDAADYIKAALNFGNIAGSEERSGCLDIYGAGDAADRTRVINSFIGFNMTPDYTGGWSGGERLAAEANDFIRLYMPGGNISLREYALYGWR